MRKHVVSNQKARTEALKDSISVGIDSQWIVTEKKEGKSTSELPLCPEVAMRKSLAGTFFPFITHRSSEVAETQRWDLIVQGVEYSDPQAAHHLRHRSRTNGCAA